MLDWADTFPEAANGSAAATGHDLIVANLFLHHFEAATLAHLLQAVALRTGVFIACEPRRSRLALLGSHLVGALGANAVTRQDAVLSVHAGFRERELSQVWQAGAPGWRLQERAAGAFSHVFSAVRGPSGVAGAMS